MINKKYLLYLLISLFVYIILFCVLQFKFIQSNQGYYLFLGTLIAGFISGGITFWAMKIIDNANKKRNKLQYAPFFSFASVKNLKFEKLEDSDNKSKHCICGLAEGQKYLISCTLKNLSNYPIIFIESRQVYWHRYPSKNGGKYLSLYEEYYPLSCQLEANEEKKCQFIVLPPWERKDNILRDKDTHQKSFFVYFKFVNALGLETRGLISIQKEPELYDYKIIAIDDDDFDNLTEGQIKSKNPGIFVYEEKINPSFEGFFERLKELNKEEEQTNIN